MVFESTLHERSHKSIPPSWRAMSNTTGKTIPSAQLLFQVGWTLSKHDFKKKWEVQVHAPILMYHYLQKAHTKISCCFIFLSPHWQSHTSLIFQHALNLIFVIASVHRWSIHSSGTIGSVSVTRKESLQVLSGEWVILCLLGDWTLLDELNLCTPENECTPRAGEWERLQAETKHYWKVSIHNQIRTPIKPGCSYTKNKKENHPETAASAILASLQDTSHHTKNNSPVYVQLPLAKPKRQDPNSKPMFQVLWSRLWKCVPTRSL